MIREDGYSLPEVMIAMVIAMVVVIGTFVLIKTTMDLSTGVVRRTDAMQRGRTAVDRVTRQLRSQVCLNATTPAIVAGNDTSVTFYADLGAGDTAPARHTLTLDPIRRTLTETRFQGAAAVPGGPVLFPPAPTRESRLLENVVAAPGDPVFRYFRFATTGSPRRTTVVLPVPLTAADRARVARIEIAFVARPLSTRDTSRAFELREQISVRHADPNAISPTPACA